MSQRNPGRIESHPRIIFPSILDSNKPGTKAATPRVDTAPHDVETRPVWLIDDWMGFMALAPPGEGWGLIPGTLVQCLMY